MTFLGNFETGPIKETSLPRSLIVAYVQQLFKRADFPEEIFIVLADSTVANKGDVVWANIDNEHPYDFVPMPRIDQLILNLPSKKQFLEAMGAENLENVSAEAESRYWQQYRFNFARDVDGVSLTWH